MRSLVNVGISVPGQINFAIVPQPARKDSPSDKVASSHLSAQIRTVDENIRIVLDFFKPDFFDKGYFDKVFEGDPTPLRESPGRR